MSQAAATCLIAYIHQCLRVLTYTLANKRTHPTTHNLVVVDTAVVFAATAANAAHRSKSWSFPTPCGHFSRTIFCARHTAIIIDWQLDPDATFWSLLTNTRSWRLWTRLQLHYLSCCPAWLATKSLCARTFLVGLIDLFRRWWASYATYIPSIDNSIGMHHPIAITSVKSARVQAASNCSSEITAANFN